MFTTVDNNFAGAFLGFKQMSSDILFYESPIQHNYISTSASLVILCAWMDAPAKALAKYAAAYREILPTAEIIVIRSDIRHITYVSNATRNADLDPACQIVQAHRARAKARGSEEPTALLHAFSNAGALSATQLLSSLRSTSSHNDLRALILDSCPGSPDYNLSVQAVQYGVKQHVLLRLLGLAAAHLAMSAIAFCDIVLGIENTVAVGYRRLNDDLLIDKAVPRLYLYSKADQMVPYASVKQHSEEARRRGYTSIREKLFESGPHCALVTVNKDAYWTVVKETLQGC